MPVSLSKLSELLSSRLAQAAVCSVCGLLNLWITQFADYSACNLLKDSAEECDGFFERFDKCVNFARRVVKIQAGAGGGTDSEQLV